MYLVSLEVFHCSLPSGCHPVSTTKDVDIIASGFSVSMNLSNFEKPVNYLLHSDSIYYINDQSRQKFQSKVIIREIFDSQIGLNGNYLR